MYAGVARLRRRGDQLPGGARPAARHQGHPVRPARRHDLRRRPRDAQADHELPGPVLPGQRDRGASPTPGTTATGTSTRGRRTPSRTTPSSTARRSTRGSRRRASRAGRCRWARSPRCSSATRPATDRSRSTPTRCSSTAGGDRQGQARARPCCTRRSGGTRRGRSGAPRLSELALKHLAAPHREHRQGRRRDLHAVDLSVRGAARVRLPRGAARHALALGGDPRRQDRQLPGGRAVHLERRAARREGAEGAVRGVAGGQPDRRRTRSRSRSCARSTRSTRAWRARSTRWTWRATSCRRSGL